MCKILAFSSLHFGIEYHVERDIYIERVWTKDGQRDLWICVIVLDVEGIPSFRRCQEEPACDGRSLKVHHILETVRGTLIHAMAPL